MEILLFHSLEISYLSTGHILLGASLVAQRLKRLPGMQETWVWFLGREDPLEKEMATHSSTLAWRIPWREEPGRLQSMGSQRVGHDWATSLHFTSLHILFLAFLVMLLSVIALHDCIHVGKEHRNSRSKWLVVPSTSQLTHRSADRNIRDITTTSNITYFVL